MSDTTPHSIDRLKWPLWANVVATITLIVMLFGVVYTGYQIVFAIGHWVSVNENQIASNKTDVDKTERDVATLQANIVSLDSRVNELTARVLALHNLSDQADAALKARLDIIDALNKFTAERALQPPLPAPYQGPRR